MAKRKKLNWKVISLGLLLLVVVLCIPAWKVASNRFAFGSWNGYWTAAQQRIEAKEYKAADRSLGKAYKSATRAKDTEAMIQILNEMAELHKIHAVSADVESPSYHLADWNKAVGCWNKIVTLDPKNVEARRKVLNFYYELSDSGSSNQYWKDVETNADELIKLYRENNEPGDPLLPLYLGQARLMQAEIGEAANRDTLCDNAIKVLQEAQKVLPKNPKVYELIAQAFRLQGELAKGISSNEKLIAKKAMDILKSGKDEIPDNPLTHINWIKSQEDALSLVWKEIGQSLQVLSKQLDSEWQSAEQAAIKFASGNKDYDKILIKRQTSIRKATTAFYAYLDSLSKLRTPTPESIQRQMANKKSLQDSFQDNDFQEILKADPSKEPFFDFAKSLSTKLRNIESPVQKDAVVSEKDTDPENSFVFLMNWLVNQSANWSDQKGLEVLAGLYVKSIELVNSEYEDLCSKFSNQSIVYSALSEFHMRQSNSDGAIGNIEKAHDLDKTKFDYALQAAILYYRQSGMTSDSKESLEMLKKAIGITSDALAYPDTQDTPGPRQGIQANRRLGLYNYLAGWQIEKYRLEKEGEIKKQQELKKLEGTTATKAEIDKFKTEAQAAQEAAATAEKGAETAIQQIQQFLKTSDNVYMGKWRGMLALAKGQVAMEAASAETDAKVKADKTRNAGKQISDAVTTLYAAYQQLAGLKQNDPQLSYALAEAFRGRSELGARLEFLGQSLASPNNSIASTKPDALLEYAEILLGAGDGSGAINVIDAFESSFSPSTRSQEIRFQGLLLTGQFDKAEEWIKSLDPASDRLSAYNALLIHKRIGSLNSEITKIKDSLSQLNLQRELLEQVSKTADPQNLDSLAKPKEDLDKRQKEFTQKQTEVQAQIDTLVPQRQTIVESMMQKDPKTVDPAIVMEVCRQLNKEAKGARDEAESLAAKKDAIDKVKTLTDKAKSLTDKAKVLAADFIKATPRYVPMLSFAKTLDFPPGTVLTEEQKAQIAIASIREAMPDQKVDQAVAIAQYYLSIPETDAAKRRANRDKARTEFQSIAETAAEDSQVIQGLFNLALTPDSDQPDAKPDLVAARTWAQKAKELDIDHCGGLFFQARIDLADRQYVPAIEKLTECIRIIPIFPQAYFSRAGAQQALGNLPEAAKDADRAYEWNPTDGDFARLRSIIYYQLYRKAGSNPTPEEYNKMDQAMLSAVMLNQEDKELLNFYADLIKDREPERALGMRQNIMARFPSPENGRLLGSLALRLYDTYETSRISQVVLNKEFLLLTAKKALEKAREMAPNDPGVMNIWGEYLRASGQQNLAEQTLPRDSLALAYFYLNDGKYEKAQAILQQFYEKDQKDPNQKSAVLRGLAIVALKTDDSAGIERYARELTELNLDDPKVKEATDLWALQRLLEARLDPEKTRQRVASFRERYPGNLDGLVMQAWSDFNAGAFADAQARIGEILTQKPDHAVAWRIRGVLNRINSDFKGAIADLQKSLSFVDDPITRMELAQTYVMSNQITSAIGELVAALEKPQSPVRARYFLESIYQKYRKEDLPKFYDQAVAKYSDDPYWLHRAGAYVLTQYQNQYDQEKAQAQKQGKLKPGAIFTPSDKTLALLEKAKPLLEKSWTLVEDKWKQNPQDAYARMLDFYLESLLQGLENQTQLTQFIRIASKYVNTPLATIAYSQIAQAHLRLGERTQGLEFFDKALESAKAQPEYVVQLLDVMRKVLESDKEVRAWCDKTLAADPKHIGANYTMFQLSQSSGQFNTAIEYIDRCLAQLQTRDDTWVEYTIQKSQVLLQAFFKTSDKKYLDGGVALYESILQANPNHPKIPMILNNLAFLLADNNQQLDKAVEYARRALKEASNDPVRMDTLSYTLSKSSQFEEAEKMARMSIQYHELAGNSVPWDGYYHLGMAQEGLKKKSEAKASYQKALDTGGDAIPAPDKEQLAAALKRVSQ